MFTQKYLSSSERMFLLLKSSKWSPGLRTTITSGSKNRRVFCATVCRSRVNMRLRNRAILMLRMVKMAPRTPPMTPINNAGANIITFTGMALPSCTHSGLCQYPTASL